MPDLTNRDHRLWGSLTQDGTAEEGKRWPGRGREAVAPCSPQF